MITIDTIARHELIGLDTQVVESSNLQLVGLNGRVINETKSMITINTKKGKKAGGYNNSGYGQEMMQGPYDNLMTPR